MIQDNRPAELDDEAGQSPQQNLINVLISIGVPVEKIAGLEPDGSMRIQSAFHNISLLLDAYSSVYAAKTKYLQTLRAIAAIVVKPGIDVESNPAIALRGVSELAKRYVELIKEHPSTLEVTNNAG